MNKLKIKKVENNKELEETFNIRKIVFIEGQNVSVDIEMDGLESIGEHFIVYYEDKPIGCARIRTENKIAKLERIAIMKEFRGKGFGKKLTNFLIEYCKQKDIEKIKIHSQTYVADFYEKLGFIPVGDTFFEAGIEHIEMYMKLS